MNEHLDDVPPRPFGQAGGAVGDEPLSPHLTLERFRAGHRTPVEKSTTRQPGNGAGAP